MSGPRRGGAGGSAAARALETARQFSVLLRGAALKTCGVDSFARLASSEAHREKMSRAAAREIAECNTRHARVAREACGAVGADHHAHDCGAVGHPAAAIGARDPPRDARER